MQALLDDYARGTEFATHLVNTSPLVWHGEEKLANLETLEGFLAEHTYDNGPLMTPLTTADLTAIRDLRDQLRPILEASTAEDVVSAAGALTAGAGQLNLHVDASGRHQWAVKAQSDAPLTSQLSLLAGTGLLGVLRTLGFERFRACSSPVCDGLFVDVSRSGRRRYCMPELCGNRINVAAHRARQKATT